MENEKSLATNTKNQISLTKRTSHNDPHQPNHNNTSTRIKSTSETMTTLLVVLFVILGINYGWDSIILLQNTNTVVRSLSNQPLIAIATLSKLPVAILCAITTILIFKRKKLAIRFIYITLGCAMAPLIAIIILNIFSFSWASTHSVFYMSSALTNLIPLTLALVLVRKSKQIKNALTKR